MNANGSYKALFVDDDPPYGIIIECESCKEQFTDKSEQGEQCICPSCGAELRYPEGSSW